MLEFIGIVVIVVLLGIGIVSCSSEPDGETIKTEKQMIMQETDRTNEKLSNR